MPHDARALLMLGLAVPAIGCTESADAPRSPHAAVPRAAVARPRTRAEQFELGEHVFRPATEARAPAPSDVAGCDGSDAALEAVAARLAHRRARGLPPLTSAELSFALRAEGSPHVWPRAWTVRTEQGDKTVAERRDRFLRTVPSEGALLCGTATAVAPDGTSAHAAVVVDALARIAPVPTRVASGQWLEIRAELTGADGGATVLLLGPSGPPFSVPSSTHRGRVQSRARLDRPGLWKLQVVAILASGPRPVLEALVAVDEEPPSRFMARPAPGEELLTGREEATQALTQLINAARAASKLPSLERDARLDAIARQHAEAMRTAGALSHDLGRGGPARRLADAGLDGIVFGENIAHARDARRGHRALFGSPSHRGNMLDPRFNTLGVGVARDTDGLIWICQVFADFAGTGISRTAR